MRPASGPASAAPVPDPFGLLAAYPISRLRLPVMFVDYTRIEVKAGDGGSGARAFRREKYVPRGGPSGGNGGDGGSVYLKSSSHLSTLLPFRYKKHFEAQRGGHGSGKKQQGKRGQDLTIEVPVGTQVLDTDTREMVCDLDAPDQGELVASGGRGGRGNAAFVSSTNQAPEYTETGKPGQSRSLVLELKVLADVGLIGYPNAGKSTLISTISAARPTVADYPFTTLTPSLGVVSFGEYDSFVVADIPGLIEGAHSGTGLGDRFLRHVERTRLLVHLVDVSELGPESPTRAVRVIDRELQAYKEKLAHTPRILVASKMDVRAEERLTALVAYAEEKELPLIKVSSVNGQGLKELKNLMASMLGVGSS